MDHAIHRFLWANNENGIIVSLDADTICDDRYLQQLELFYEKYPRANGCNVNFNHLLTENDDARLKKAVLQYELYLRYYVECLRFIEFPHSFHTIGSCFTVSALSYCKQGGMNMRQAGEDFYFLQKLFYLGEFYELNSAFVYPRARLSQRVVFGTGPALNRIYGDEGSFKVYSFMKIPVRP